MLRNLRERSSAYSACTLRVVFGDPKARANSFLALVADTFASRLPLLIFSAVRNCFLQDFSLFGVQLPSINPDAWLKRLWFGLPFTLDHCLSGNGRIHAEHDGCP